MLLDQNNPVIKLCAYGMELEGNGSVQEAVDIFYDAWTIAESDFDKAIAAHYVARHQESVQEKLEWDALALEHALRDTNDSCKSLLPSLYLNIAKCYEDLNDYHNARKNYEQAWTLAAYLPDDGYGTMIRNGIQKGLERTIT